MNIKRFLQIVKMFNRKLFIFHPMELFQGTVTRLLNDKQIGLIRDPPITDKSKLNGSNMKVIPFVPNGSNVISSQPIKLISTSNSPISSKSPISGIPAQPKYHTVVAQPTGPIKKNGTASGEVKLQKVEKIEHIENNEENTKNNYVSIAGGQTAVGTSPVGTGQPVGSAAPLQLYDKNSLINTEVPREALLKLTLERDDSPDAFHPYFSSPEKVIEYIQRIGNPCEYPYVTIPGKITVPKGPSRTVPGRRTSR